jgi:hypothetical protein
MLAVTLFCAPGIMPGRGPVLEHDMPSAMSTIISSLDPALSQESIGRVINKSVND